MIAPYWRRCAPICLTILAGCQTAAQAANDEAPTWEVVVGLALMALMYIAGFVTLYRK